MRTLDVEGFLDSAMKIDDTSLSCFLDETGFARDVGDVGYEGLFKKFIGFMTADKPEEIADSISLEDISSMIGYIGNYADILSGDGSIAYSTVWSRLRKMKSVGRRIL